MKVPFVFYGRSYTNHKEELDFEIQRVLSAGDLVLRKDVEAFEANLAAFVGTKYAVALNSGTDALVLALKASGLKKWEGVGVPSHTFKATVGAIKTCQLKPLVYDMDGKFNTTQRPQAIIPVHITGELSEVPIGIPVIEDAAQALGAVKNPTSLAQTWSFYPAKILGAFGDAGALTTNDERVYTYVREARNHFKTDNRGFGINSRMDNLQATILNVKFRYLPQYLARRQEIAEKYREGLKGLEAKGVIKLPNYTQGRSWQDYIIRVL